MSDRANEPRGVCSACNIPHEKCSLDTWTTLPTPPVDAPPASHEIILDTVRSVLDQLKPENDCDSVLEKEAAEDHIREMLAPAAPPQDVHPKGCFHFKTFVCPECAAAERPAPAQEDLERARNFREREIGHFAAGEGESMFHEDNNFDRALAAEFASIRRAAQAERQVVWEELLSWLQERYENCLRLANEKSGLDQQGWMDDAKHFQDVISLIRGGCDEQ